MTNMKPSTFNFQLGLVGYPVSHSLSPKIQNAALKACGLEGDYSLYPIEPDDIVTLKAIFDRVRSGEITGLNVTIPHKQNVIGLMDELTPTAKIIGAVNAIYLRENKLIGDNTDAPGFLKDLNHFLASNQSKIVNRKSAIVLGAGGSARSVVYALTNDGWHVTIAARRIEQAQQLANSFSSHKIQITELPNLQPSTLRQAQGNAFNLLVNTTPIGMTPNINESPWPENLPFPNANIYDLVYNPRETKLVKDARAQGLNATTGLGMLIEQAALGFELWTGYELSSEIFRNAVE